MADTDKLTPALAYLMRRILESLEKSPKIESELLDTIPNCSLELLGKLRDLNAIDHHGHIIYITSIGENILNKSK